MMTHRPPVGANQRDFRIRCDRGWAVVGLSYYGSEVNREAGWSEVEREAVDSTYAATPPRNAAPMSPLLSQKQADLLAARSADRVVVVDRTTPLPGPGPSLVLPRIASVCGLHTLRLQRLQSSGGLQP